MDHCRESDCDWCSPGGTIVFRYCLFRNLSIEVSLMPIIHGERREVNAPRRTINPCLREINQKICLGMISAIGQVTLH